MIHALFTVRELLYLFYLISLAKNLGQHYRRWSMLTNAMRNIAHFFLAKNGFIRLCPKLQCSNSIAQVSQSRCQNRTPLKWTSFSGSLGTSCSPNEAWQGHWYPKSSQICLNSLRPHGFHLGRRPPNSQQRCARSMSEDTFRYPHPKSSQSGRCSPMQCCCH